MLVSVRRPAGSIPRKFRFRKCAGSCFSFLSSDLFVLESTNRASHELVSSVASVPNSFTASLASCRSGTNVLSKITVVIKNEKTVVTLKKLCESLRTELKFLENSGAVPFRVSSAKLADSRSNRDVIVN